MALGYEKKGHVVTITFNRPESLNAIDRATSLEFSAALIELRDDPDAWAAIITGAGDKAFSAGADLKRLPDDDQERQSGVPPTIMRGLDVWKPIIAAVNGLALGGGLEVALACDLRIASEKARFGLPEARWSVMPAWGGTQRLARTIPQAKAAEMLLIGDMMDAAEAWRLGLVNKVVPPDQLMAEAEAWAARICENGPLAVQYIKQAMVTGGNVALNDGLRLEQFLTDALFLSEDSSEGIRAFREKRKPDYKAK